MRALVEQERQATLLRRCLEASAQPAHVFPGTMSSDRLESPAVTRKETGVDDGFRTRDLRIHNPAL